MLKWYQGNILNLLYYYTCYYTVVDQQKENTMYKIMNTTIEYIEANLLNDLSLNDIAHQSNYSKTHMSRMFNKIVGVSLTEYINRRRLTNTALMLKDTDKPIEYISDIYRFGSSKYFSTMFRKEFGISPSMYRRGNKIGRASCRERV